MIGEWSIGAYLGLRDRGASRRDAFAAVFVTAIETSEPEGLFSETVERVEEAGDAYDEWLDYMLLLQLAKLEDRLRDLGVVE